MSVFVPIVIILILIALNGLFVAAEFAIVASRRSRLQRLASEGSSSAAQAADIVGDAEAQDRYIAIAQLGITLASVGLGMYGERSIAEWIENPLHALGAPHALAHTVAIIIAVSILTYLHVVIGEMIPKALALTRPEPTTLRVMPAMRLFGLGLRPLVWALTEIGNKLLGLLGVPVSGHGRAYTTTELEQLVDESAEEGVVAQTQHTLIDNIFSFGERTAAQLMTHRTKVVGLELGDSPDKVKDIIQNEGFSRLPIYRDTLDDVEGILHVRDYIRATTKDEMPALRQLVRRVPRVPEHLPAETLLESFKRLKVHMAVVVNEHGGTAGIVTLEDLLEEVVGEVEDEFDEAPVPDIEELAEGELRVAGNTLLDELNHRYDLNFSTEHAETIGGLIVDELGTSASEGDAVTLSDVELRVERVEELAVSQVHMRFASDDEEDSSPPKH